jgi:predicted transglutaminase-like protease
MSKQQQQHNSKLPLRATPAPSAAPHVAPRPAPAASSEWQQAKFRYWLSVRSNVFKMAIFIIVTRYHKNMHKHEHTPFAHFERSATDRTMAW